MMMISLDQMVDKESFARVIDAYVDGLVDVSALGFKNAQLNKEGRPPFHPNDMIKLFLFGYFLKVRSGRELEKACQSNIEMRWLLKGLVPVYRTINKFRKNNKEALGKLFREFVGWLSDNSLVEGKCIAIDSTKVRAQNAKQKTYNAKKIKEQTARSEAKIAEYERALEKSENEEERDLLAEKIENKKQRRALLDRIKKKVDESESGQVSLTDPDARMVRMRGQSVEVGYNIQAASDSKHNLLVAVDTGDCNDAHALTDMTEQAFVNMKKAEELENRKENKDDSPAPIVLADTGYHTGLEIEKTQKLGVETYVATRPNTSSKKNGVYPKEDFIYDADNDSYTCPAGEKLHTDGKWYKRKNHSKGKSPEFEYQVYKTQACKGCPLRAKCTTQKDKKRGRQINRQQFQENVDRNKANLKNNPDYYCKRQQIIEHQFGTLKRHWGFTHVQTRGKESVLAECSMIFTVYNLRRLVSILGFNDLQKALKASFFAFWTLTCLAKPQKA